MIGQTLSHYLVLEQIGAGGMGVVYRAHDQRLERDVALKVLPSGMLQDEMARRRFRREALTLAKLNHPNVGVVYDFHSQEGVDFLVMELISGTALDTKLLAGPLPQKDVLRLGIQLADGLEAAHQQGVVHRDLKPANLRLTGDGRLKILDFGLARVVRQEGDLGLTASVASPSLTGTLPYMAPEQLRGEPADARSDIWAAGAVLYEMTTGRRPFPEKNAPMLIDAILHHVPAPPSTLVPRTAPGLEAAILKALDKDPEHRYQSARELRIDLERLTGGLGPIVASTSGTASRGTGLSTTNSRLEIAHVLCVEPLLEEHASAEERTVVEAELRELVDATPEVQAAERDAQISILPTEASVILIFFGDPERSARCAVELARALRAHPELPVRMGLHTGPVYRVPDMATNLRGSSNAIALAQQITKLGDAGHILVTKNAADVLSQVSAWSSGLHDAGETEIRRGVPLSVFNLHTRDVGNASLPKSLRGTGPSSHPRRWVAVAGVVGLVLVIGAIWLSSLRLRSPSQVTPTAARRRAVAVLGFRNLTQRPESAWLSTALSQMLTTEMAAGETLRAVPGDDVAQMKMDLSMADTDSLARDALARIGKNLGADLVVLGSYVSLTGGKVRFDFRLQDSSSGDVLFTDAETGDENNLFDLVSRAGAKLRSRCGAGEVSARDAPGVRAALPSNPEASRLYAEGLAKLRVFDALSARALLQKAVHADPNHAMAHSALAAAWTALGYDEKARQSAKNAFDLSAGLAREDRLLIEARYREASADWDDAAALYRTLYGFFPDNVEYGIALTKAQARAGKPKDALATADSMRRQPPPASDDPRIDLAASGAARDEGDFQQAFMFASAALTKAEQREAKLLAARALYQQADALESLSRPQEALAAVNRAKDIYGAAGDRYGVASTLEEMGNWMSDRGDLDGAIHNYEAELAMVREIGNKRAEASALNNLGTVLWQRGDLERARSMFEQALASFREIGDKGNAAQTLLNIGGIFKDRGELTGSSKMYQQALELATEVNDKNGIALASMAQGSVFDAEGDLVSARRALERAISLDAESGRKASDKLIELGDILQHQGNLEQARRYYEDALTLTRQSDEKSAEAYALMGLGDVAKHGANYTVAGQRYDEALKLRTELGEKDTILSTQVAKAALMVAAGDPAPAEALLRQALQQVDKVRRSDDAVLIAASLTECLLAQKKISDAESVVRSESAAATRSSVLQARLAFATASARALAASGKASAAEAQLRPALVQAQKSGMLGEEFKIRLAQAEVEMASGNAVGARAHLDQLEQDAHARGYERIALQAARTRDHHESR